MRNLMLSRVVRYQGWKDGTDLAKFSAKIGLCRPCKEDAQEGQSQSLAERKAQRSQWSLVKERGFVPSTGISLFTNISLNALNKHFINTILKLFHGPWASGLLNLKTGVFLKHTSTQRIQTDPLLKSSSGYHWLQDQLLLRHSRPCLFSCSVLTKCCPPLSLILRAFVHEAPSAQYSLLPTSSMFPRAIWQKSTYLPSLSSKAIVLSWALLPASPFPPYSVFWSPR